jgi:diguanylate cyclase (GGDEF)-like protein/PAS domain S-box-containing protein
MATVVDSANYSFNGFAVPTLAAALVMLAVGVRVLVRERRSQEARLFFAVSVCVAAWLGCFSLMYLSNNAGTALVWSRLAYLGITFIPVAVYAFAESVTRHLRARRRGLWIAWACAALFCVGSVGTDALVAEVRRYRWGYYPLFRWLGVPFLLFFAVMLTLALREYWLAWRAAQDPRHRQRSGWLMVGFAVAYIGSVDYLAAYGIPLYPFGYLPILLFTVIASWTIRRFRLVDYTPEFAARQILATMVDPLLVCDRQGVIRLANAAVGNVLGYRHEDLVGQPVTMLASPGAIQQRIAALARSHETVVEDLTLHAQGGQSIDVGLTVSPLADPGGVLVGTVVVARDLRLYRRAERAVKASDERFRVVAETAGQAIVTADSTGVILYANVAADRLFGHASGTLPGRSLTDLMPQRLRASHTSGMERYLETGEAHMLGRTVELFGQRADGSEFPLELTLAHWSSEEGVFFSGIFQDTSERKRAEETLQRSEATFRAMAESSPAAIFLSEDGRLLEHNAAAVLMVGSSSEELSRMKAWEIAHPLSRDVLRQVLEPSEGDVRPARLELRIGQEDARERWMDVTVAPLPGGRRAVLWAYDITDSKLAHEAARLSERRLRDLLENVQLMALSVDVDGTVTYCNRYLLEILGCEPEDIIGGNWFERWLPESDRERVAKSFASNICHGIVSPYEEIALLTSHGERRLIGWSNTVLRDARGQTLGCASIGADITERKLAEDRLAHQALHDALTGLPNRALFMDRTEVAIARSKRSGGGRFAVLFLDLDRFKTINDSLGHLLGDQLLIQASRRIAQCLRPGDTVARLGGDEFTVLLEELDDPADAGRVAERIKNELGAPYNLEGREVFVSASIGITLAAERYHRPEELLRDADTALQRAKERGKGGYQLFDTPMHRQSVAVLELENDLRRALDRNEFCLYYQPIVQLADRKLVGFEALVRWQHPQRGLMFPDQFIPLAEETGLIVRLGEWVAREACAQLRRWITDFPTSSVSLTANVSSRQFAQPDIVERFASALEDSNIPPRRFKIEITESSIVEDPEGVTNLLQSLRRLGCGVCMDDFGTGYSSLSYLLRLPIDTLKIDRSFLRDLAVGSRNTDIIWAVILLGQRLGLEVVAEGVETEKQRELLLELGCVLGQGFLFSRPVEVSVAAKILAESMTA